jgi:hypothetical protein
LTDDEPKEIKVPIIVNKGESSLRQNYINDQTAKTHEYDVVGWLETTVVEARHVDKYQSAFYNI